MGETAVEIGPARSVGKAMTVVDVLMRAASRSPRAMAELICINRTTAVSATTSFSLPGRRRATHAGRRQQVPHDEDGFWDRRRGALASHRRRAKAVRRGRAEGHQG